MPSITIIIGTIISLYLSSFIYTLLKNIFKARQIGLPSIIVPLDQNHLVWMILSPPFLRTFERWLPDQVYLRICLAIYGHEFHVKSRPYKELAGPRGNDKSFILTGCGKLELWTSDSNLTSQILARPKDFNQLELANLILNKFGQNVLSTDGEHWARQREVVAGVINERISKAVWNESVRQTQGLLHQVQSRADKNGVAETNQLFEWAKKITIHVLSGAGMGVSVPWEDMAMEKPKPGFKQTYIQSVKHVINNMSGPILLPEWFLNNYPRLLPGQQNLRNLGIAVEEFPTLTRELLANERQRTQDEGGATKSNILSQLIQASDNPVDPNTKSSNSKQGQALTESELLGNLFIFTGAGFDTTANTISYALVLLARYPEWQDWLLQEIDQILPADREAELDYAATFGNLTRTLAFMYEVLRFFPPLIHISKQTKTTQTLQTPAGPVTLPPNTTVYVDTVALHLDADVWRNLNLSKDETPSDDDECVFRPSRWMNPPGSAQVLFNPPKGTYVPWSGGPRICPGQKMAQVEFMAIFLTILREHKIEAALTGGESRQQVNDRLDKRMSDSISVLTSQMEHVYDVKEEDPAGLRLKICRRK